MTDDPSHGPSGSPGPAGPPGFPPNPPPPPGPIPAEGGPGATVGGPGGGGAAGDTPKTGAYAGERPAPRRAPGPAPDYEGPPASPGFRMPNVPLPTAPADLARLVTITAWVVAGLFALSFLYGLTQEDFGGNVADRFFGGMPTLGQGLFYAGVLHAVGVWLAREKGPS